MRYYFMILVLGLASAADFSLRKKGRPSASVTISQRNFHQEALIYHPQIGAIACMREARQSGRPDDKCIHRLHGSRSMPEATLHPTGKLDNARGPLQGSRYEWEPVHAGGHIEYI